MRSDKRENVAPLERILIFVELEPSVQLIFQKIIKFLTKMCQSKRI